MTSLHPGPQPGDVVAPDAEAARRPRSPSGQWVVTTLLGVGGVAALALGPRGEISPLGLVTALPWAYVAALVALLVVFALNLTRQLVRPGALRWQVVVVAVLLALAPVLLEPLPRFPTAYTHAGFVDLIQRTGSVLSGYDARFSWPAFFAASALFADASGLQPDDLIRWSPLLLDLLYLLAFGAYVRRFVTGHRQQALAAMMLVIFNWVGQDYFAPQGFAFFLQLAFLAALAAVFPFTDPDSRAARLLSRLTLRRRGEQQPAAAVPAPTRVLLMALALVVFCGVVVSHQLTPIVLVLAVVAVVALGCVRWWNLPVLLGALVLAYIEWAARDYWSGHLGELLSGVGKLQSALQQNVTERVSSGTAQTLERTVVVRVRLALTALLWLLALLGFWRDRSRRMLVPALLAVAPFAVLGLQSYGGEAMLRIQFFALPHLCALAAVAFCSSRHNAAARGALRIAARVAVAVIASTVLVLGFFTARYGNESFEQATPQDARLVAEFYDEAPDGATVYSISDMLPWKDQRVGDLTYAFLGPELFSDPRRLDDLRESPGPTYLVLTKAQWMSERQLDGISDASIQQAKQRIESTPWLVALTGDADSGIFVVEAGA